MTLPVSMEVIGKTEAALKVRFPLAFKLKMSVSNGGYADLDGERWYLLPFEDLSSRSTIRKTANNIRVETQRAISSGLGFPVDGIAIAENGAADLLFLRHDGAELHSEVWIFRHRGGKLVKARKSIEELWPPKPV